MSRSNRSCSASLSEEMTISGSRPDASTIDGTPCRSPAISTILSSAGAASAPPPQPVASATVITAAPTAVRRIFPMLSSPLDRRPPVNDLLNSKLLSQLHAMK